MGSGIMSTVKGKKYEVDSLPTRTKGRGPRHRLLPEDLTCFKKPGIDTVGFVADTEPEMQSWTAMVVPLHYGGGTRLKIVEALSRKCPIVSTAPGAYGIEAQHDRDILLANEPDDFAAACLKLLNDPQAALNIAENGWQLFLKNYDWDHIGLTIKHIIETFPAKPK